MIQAQKVSVKNVQVGDRIFDQIRVSIADMLLTCDLTDDRQIRLAYTLAQDHGATFIWDDHNDERVSAALYAGATKLRQEAKP